MFKNYFKIAWRNVNRHKADTTVNLVGLCVAFTAALLLFLSVYYELSFDRFHKNGDNIYHLYLKIQTPKEAETNGAMPVPLLPALQAAYPEIKYGVRYINRGGTIRYKDKKFERDMKLADADFFQMFSFPFLKGNPQSALNDLNNVVLRAAAAKAIFGDEDPMGKLLQIKMNGGWKPFTVAGITADVPDNSSITYDMVIRFENDEDYNRNITSWNNFNHDVYIQLQDGISHTTFEKKLPPFINQHFAKNIQRLKRDGAVAVKDGSLMQLQLQPLAKIHTDTGIRAEGNPIGISYLYLLLIIGLLIITIACINFINLSIGRSFTRSHEIGLRKTLGAQRWQLTVQFWSESFLICFFSLMISCVLCYILLPYYRQLFSMNIHREILFSPSVWTGIFLFFLLITLLAGGYPAWLMARFNVIQILKGKISIRQSQKLRNSLIVVQFSIAILLMICTVVSWQQITYLRSKSPGYNRSQVISIPVEGDINPNAALQLMRNKLAAQPAIENVSGMYDNLGKGLDGSSRTSVMGFDYKNREIKSTWMGVSYDFVKTLDLQLTAGRDFSKNFPTDSNAVVINEAMAEQLREKNIIGTLLPVRDSQSPMPVIGVVKDFHFEDLRNKIAPLTLVLEKSFGINYILVKVKPTGLPTSMQLLKNTWKQIAPNNDFKGSFLDENIERQYLREEKLGKIFISGASIAIILSCMGLLAMVILIAAQRIKEIGIRKVLGASVPGIIVFVSKDFLWLVLIAFVIAAPIAWWAMNSWLESFAYRTNIHWWVFAIVGIVSLLIALVTIGFQAIKAAMANPVKSLRTE